MSIATPRATRNRLWVLLLILCFALPVGEAEARGKKKRNKKKKAPVSSKVTDNFVPGDLLLEMSLESRSLSQGQVNRGRVTNSDSMPIKGRTWQFLPAVKGRKTNFGKPGLVRLIKKGADAVDEQFPGSVLTIGNIGLEKGGKIGQSKSHQAGRDVDIAPLYRNKKGRMAHPARFFPVDREGKSRRGLVLDVPRTWAFVKTLIQSEDPVVQWMFISKGVKALLLDHARKTKEPRFLIRRAEAILHQPTDSSDHSDHFHIRVYCSSWDRLVGCADYGPTRSHLRRDLRQEKALVRDLTRRANHGTGKERLAATRRLAVLSSDLAVDTLDKLLCDEDAEVVKGALAGLSRMTRNSTTPRILARLKCASGVEAQQLLLAAVADHVDERVWKKSSRLLKSQKCLDIDQCEGRGCKGQRMLCETAASTLGYSTMLKYGKTLVPYVTSNKKSTRVAAVRSLEKLYGTDTPPAPPGAKKRPSLAERWQRLVKKNSSKPWDRFIRRQFRESNVKITGALVRKKNATALFKALERDWVLAYSAQVALARIYGVQLDRALSRKEARQKFKKLVAADGRRTNSKHGPRQAGRLPTLPL